MLSHAFCREFSALEESRQLWLAMMKACRVRGPAGEPGLKMCARNLAITLTSIADGKTQQQKCGEAEVLYREALLVSSFACFCICPSFICFDLVNGIPTKRETNLGVFRKYTPFYSMVLC